MDNTADIPQEEWEELERYLHNELSPDEQTAMEERLAGDALLRQKLAEVSLVRLGVQEAALQEKLMAFHHELDANDNSHRIGGRPSAFRTWLVAASVLLVVCAVAWFLLLRGNNNERLFAAYFKPDPGLMTAMSATDNYVFEKAMIDYKGGEYAAAITAWDSLQKAQPADDTLQYFLGVAYLAKGAGYKTVSYLENVAGTNSFFSADAQWYLALALLKEGKRDAAVKVLEKAEHPKKEELLKALRKETK